LNKLLLIIKLIPKLGYYNFAYAAWYKIGMKYGLFKYRFPILKFNKQVSFATSIVAKDYNPIWLIGLKEQADKIISGEFTWFSIHKFKTGEIPQWFQNPFNRKKINNPHIHWTEIGDFNSGVGDVKSVWELSRFNWLTTLARAYKVTGDIQYLDRLNLIINNWIEHNSLNQGPNWMCGQETSIRLMKILTTTTIIDIKESCKEGLNELIAHHVDRINANIKYGVIQDNNHGTSEAAGMYTGSLWLINQNHQVAKYQLLKNKGRAVLEGRIEKLIQKDGSFSQRSCNYHRVVVDTMSFVLQMISIHREPPFSVFILDRLTKLGEWQYKMIFGQNGEAPNYGSNDGAMIETLHSGSYEDFRISTQLFFALLLKRRIYGMASVSEPIYWRSDVAFDRLPFLDIERPMNELLDDHIGILRNNRASVFIKLPDDKFRPGNDTGHIDLWLDGVNILRDSGSFSYNAGEITEFFKSVSSHNTVQFGQHEQLPKISRFLNGDWISAEYLALRSINESSSSIEFQYSDFKGNKHRRKVVLNSHSLSIIDIIVSDERSYVQYHLSPNWDDSGLSIRTNGCIEDGTSMYSKYYNLKKDGPSKKIEIQNEEVFVIFDWSR